MPPTDSETVICSCLLLVSTALWWSELEDFRPHVLGADLLVCGCNQAWQACSKSSDTSLLACDVCAGDQIQPGLIVGCFYYRANSILTSSFCKGF